jgi:DNA integrity scanning protein DisA with diadenylate cyclase activity
MLPSTLNDFRTEVKATLGGDPQTPRKKPTRINRLILREAEKIATSARCQSVLIFGDTFAGGVELTQTFTNLKTVLVTQAGAESSENEGQVSEFLPIRSFSNHRMSQLRSAILIGLTRGIFSPDELICCVGGLPQSNRFDSILVVDVAREFHTLFSDKTHTLPPSLRPEVMERVLGIAMELGLEGREGKKVGCLFVLGDTQKVLEFSKPLVLNPFYGYREEDRNVLNPFMDETVKEFSSIDGAFIIRGNGVIEAAGTLLRAPEYPDLPGGLGARHAAAAAITKSTRSLAIVVSESTGQVTLFSNGDMVSLLSHAVGGNF